MSNKKYLVVINPQAGNKGRRSLNKVISGIEKKEYSYDVYYTQADSKLNEIKLSEMLSNYSDVISIGGDGTLNMLCNVLAGKNIPLGIIPCGTGNDFARHVYVNEDNVIETVLGNNIIKIDLGWCNNRYFINVLGVGYDAMIVDKTKNDNKILFRSFFYLWNALKYLPFYKEINIHLQSDGFNKAEASFIVAFGNASFFGSGMNITPKADITDGLLDCCWIGKMSFIKKCQCLIKSFSGKHISADNIEYVQGKEFKILSKSYPIEADGEFLGYTPATIRIKEQILCLKIP